MSAIDCLWTDPPTCRRGVLVCQNRTCRRQGADRVLAVFQAHPIAGVVVSPSGCLGQCGNGPMVCVLPDDSWYGRVQPAEVPAIVERHLKGDQPVQALLFPRRHPVR